MVTFYEITTEYNFIIYKWIYKFFNYVAGILAKYGRNSYILGQVNFSSD